MKCELDISNNGRSNGQTDGEKKNLNIEKPLCVCFHNTLFYVGFIVTVFEIRQLIKIENCSHFKVLLYTGSSKTKPVSSGTLRCVVGGGFTSKRGTFGNVAKLDSMLCVTYGRTPDVCYTGGSSGAIYVWVGLTLSKTIKAHEGPCFATHSLEKVRTCPCLFRNQRQLM